MTIVHPAALMLKYVKILQTNQLVVGDSVQQKAFSKLVWVWCHYIYGGTLCLRFRPSLLAVALMYGACQQKGLTVRNIYNSNYLLTVPRSNQKAVCLGGNIAFKQTVGTLKRYRKQNLI